ncbi:MAG TPA: hypothetical protein VGO28_13470 [Acidimicrobiia bacterium]
MEEGPRARRRLALLVAAEAIAVVALHRLGDVDGFAIPNHDLGRWLQQSTSEEVLLVAVRIVALVAAWWLLGTTLLYVAARAARLHGAARAVGCATLPSVRRWADRAVAVSIVAATALGLGRPAAADPPPTTLPAPVVVDVDHRDPARVPARPPATARTGLAADPTPPSTVPPPGTTSPAPTTTAPVAPPTAGPPVVPVAPVAPPSPSAPTAGTTHTVIRGEHLWSIAAARVAGANGRQSGDDLAPSDVAPYWMRVVALNRPRLRSGNPDLVYPGEVVELPPL